MQGDYSNASRSKSFKTRSQSLKIHYSFFRNQSGLPFFDVLYLHDLPGNTALPLGTVVAAKKKLVTGEFSDLFLYDH